MTSARGIKIRCAGAGEGELQTTNVVRPRGSQRDALGVAVLKSPWGAAGPGALSSARSAWGPVSRRRELGGPLCAAEVKSV